MVVSIPCFSETCLQQLYQIWKFCCQCAACLLDSFYWDLSLLPERTQVFFNYRIGSYTRTLLQARPRPLKFFKALPDCHLAQTRLQEGRSFWAFALHFAHLKHRNWKPKATSPQKGSQRCSNQKWPSAALFPDGQLVGLMICFPQNSTLESSTTYSTSMFNSAHTNLAQRHWAKRSRMLSDAGCPCTWGQMIATGQLGSWLSGHFYKKPVIASGKNQHNSICNGFAHAIEVAVRHWAYAT